jgi:serine/threonine protein kinase
MPISSRNRDQFRFTPTSPRLLIMGELALQTGVMVTPRLRLERLLGEGGMGSVWIAEHLGLGTRVAVKFISSELAAQHPELSERFVQEAAAAAKISSPHVVRTFDFGSMSDGTPYLVMELLEGESLEERLGRSGPLSPQDAVVVTKQVANALDEAHRLGIVHRDIKPANIFLMRSGRDLFAKVLDFGIAKDVESADPSNITKTGVMLGTPTYMSPEQLMSAKGVTFQADLWALAVTLYEMLTGVAPFGGETVPSLIVAIYSGQFAPPSSRKPLGNPGRIDGFFAQAFAKEPQQRFASALTLSDAFTDACLGVGSSNDAPESGVTVFGTPLGAPVSTSGSANLTTGGGTSTSVGIEAIPTLRSGARPHAQSRANLPLWIGGILTGVLSISVAAYFVMRGHGSGEPTPFTVSSFSLPQTPSSNTRIVPTAPTSDVSNAPVVQAIVSSSTSPLDPPASAVAAPTCSPCTSQEDFDSATKKHSKCCPVIGCKADADCHGARVCCKIPDGQLCADESRCKGVNRVQSGDSDSAKDQRCKHVCPGNPVELTHCYCVCMGQCPE